MGFLRECVGCAEGGVCYCTDLGQDTWKHRDCWVRMTDVLEQGGLDASGCGIGCAPCDDYPSKIIAHAAAHELPYNQPGWRFLLPGAQDARGMMHELLSHHPHLVQQRMRWLRAANHDNYTYECVDAEDVPCDVWPWNEYTVPDDEFICQHGEFVGTPIQGYFGDGFFYHGRWPQTAEFGRLQCRRFPDEPLRSTTVMSLGDNTIFLTSASQGDGCGADWLIPGAGYVTKSDCLSGFEHVHTGSDPELPSPIHTPYASHSGASLPCQHIFDHIFVVSNNTSFRQRDGLDPLDVDLHNAILAKVREPGVFVRVEFDQLDHEARTGGNRGLGRFSRSWDGTGYDIMDSRLPVVRSYPPRSSRTKWFNLPVTAQLVIVKVWFALDLALPHTKLHYVLDRDEYIEPHCVVHIHVWLGLRVTIDENEHGVVAVYTEGQSGIWPDITPAGNELLLAQKSGGWQWPPAFVEWRGVLNNFSQPSLQGQDFPRQVGEEHEDWNIHGPYGKVLKSACTALETWTVPGAPVHLDHNVTDPNQHWIGGVAFNFTSSDEYTMCQP